MATKELTTRIKVRYDTLANWESANPDLLQGEIAVVQITAGDRVNQPSYSIKVGTGEEGTTTTYGGQTGQTAINKASFKALPYVTAQAGDVYDWAKASAPPTAQTLVMGGNGNDSAQTLAARIASIEGGLVTDTDTQYQLEIGTDTNAGKIRLNYKGKNDQDYTNGSWVSVGNTIAVTSGNDTIVLDETTAGTTKVAVKISSETDNLLSVNHTSTKEGLYVPKTSVSAYTSGAGTGEVDVLTGIATSDGHTITQSVTQVYTKDKIDSLINPSMEFKGVKTAAEIAALSGVQIGDSYKISTGGTVNSSDTVKAGDLVIYVAKGTTPETYEWAIIPSGDESFTDTYREIQVNGTQLLDNALSGGEVNFVDGPGVGITGSGNDISFELDLTAGTGITITPPTAGNNDITIAADVNTIATTQMTSGNGSGKTLQGQIDTLNGADSVTGSVAKAVKDGIAGITASQSAGVDSNNKQQVFTAITQTNGVVSTTATTLSITDIDVGDYLILNGGNASSFPAAQS